MLFDVTTLYFESMEQDGLRDFGFSKDCKFKEVQVMLSLVTTDRGYPAGYKLFRGTPRKGAPSSPTWKRSKRDSIRKG